MFFRFHSVFSKKEYKTLFKNFVSLVFLQGANYILPLITLPYLVRVLGVANFGLLAFASAFVYYFNVIIEYGFNLSATRDISTHKEDTVRINEIANRVFTTKIYLFIAATFVFLSIVYGFEQLRQNALIYCLTFGTILGQILFAQWFFQGIEEMHYITFVNIFSKVLYTLGIFLFVHLREDVWLVPLLNFVSMIIVGAISVWLLIFKYGLRLRLSRLDTVIEEIKSGWHIFSAQLFTLIYTNSIIVILGVFSSATVVGYYAIADRVVKIVVSIFGPFQGAFYPYINRVIAASHTEAIRKLRRLTLYAAVAMGIASVTIFFLAKYIVLVIAGEYIDQSERILQILAPLPLVLTLAKIFSFNYLISFGHKEFLPRIYLLTAIVSIMSFLIVVPTYQAVGMAYCVLSSEVFATIYMYIVVKKRIIDGK